MTAHPESGGRNAQAGSPDGPRRPRVLVFDVNETLSDMSPMAQRFTDVGAPAHLAATWFASLLRDGFALTAAGANPAFAELGAEALRNSLSGQVGDVAAAVEHIMSGFASLPVHPDVVEGIRSLRNLGIRLVTLSNGSTAVAQGLFDRNDIADCFERLLSVDQAPLWKPAEPAYSFALQACACPPSEAMLVAVHPWDIHGAHHTGLATAWINRTGVRYPTYFTAPDLKATSVVDLAAQLGALAS
jgi:2-haloacid dehalogenase